MGTEKRERQKAARQQKIEELRKVEKRETVKSRGLLIAGLIAAFVAFAIVFSLATGDDGDDGDDVATENTAADEADGAEDPAADDTTAEDPTVADTAPEDTAPDAPAAVDPDCEQQDLQFDEPPEMQIDPEATYTATMETDVGTIELELYPDKAPITVNSFVFLAEQGYFDCLTFHRVIPDFVLQGGDPLGTGTGGPGYTFEDELPDPDEYQAGSLAMANSGPDTNGSQFFIVTSEAGAQTLVDAVGGEAAYTLFGQVTEGMDVVAAVEGDGSPSGTPNVIHRMESVTITQS